MASSSIKYICPRCLQSVRATRKVKLLCGICQSEMYSIDEWNEFCRLLNKVDNIETTLSKNPEM